VESGPNIGPASGVSHACLKWLFFQKAIQVQLHGGKNIIVLHWQMKLKHDLHVSNGWKYMQHICRIPESPKSEQNRKSCGNVRASRCEVPGLPIRGCARDCNNREHSRTQLSATHVTGKTFYERLYLVLGLRKIVTWVNCPYASTIPTIQRKFLLDFCSIFYPEWPLIFLSSWFTK